MKARNGKIARLPLEIRDQGLELTLSFGEALPNPWRTLKHGLVLGGEALVEQVRDLLGKKPGRQELRRVTRADNPEARQETARALAASLDDRSMKALGKGGTRW